MELLKQRFEEHMNRHPDLKWDDVEKRLTANIRKVIENMEQTGGEPDVVVFKDKIAYVDCCKESPKDRRSFCKQDGYQTLKHPRLSILTIP